MPFFCGLMPDSVGYMPSSFLRISSLILYLCIFFSFNFSKYPTLYLLPFCPLSLSVTLSLPSALSFCNLSPSLSLSLPLYKLLTFHSILINLSLSLIFSSLFLFLSPTRSFLASFMHASEKHFS